MPVPVAPMVIPTEDGAKESTDHSEEGTEHACNNSNCAADKSKESTEESTRYPDPYRKSEYDEYDDQKR